MISAVKSEGSAMSTEPLPSEPGDLRRVSRAADADMGGLAAALRALYYMYTACHTGRRSVIEGGIRAVPNRSVTERFGSQFKSTYCFCAHMHEITKYFLVY